MLSASEVGEFGGYCPQACWLRRHGVVGAAIGPMRRDEGIALHRDLGRRTDHLRDAEVGSRTARTVAIGLVLLAVLLLLLALVARSPLAWAAGLEDAGPHNHVSATAGPLLAGGLLAPDAVVALLAVGLGALALAAWLGRRARGLRGSLGLSGALERARVLAADDSRLGARTLRSERLGLVARPDRLVRLGNGAVIPVEQKPRARRPYPSHELELGVQLILVEARVGRRPPYASARPAWRLRLVRQALHIL